MKKLKAFFDVVKADIAAIAQSETFQQDKAEIISTAEGMLPGLFSEVETAFAKILLAAL